MAAAPQELGNLHRIILSGYKVANITLILILIGVKVAQSPRRAEEVGVASQ